jgi:hypothetical protein
VTATAADGDLPPLPELTATELDEYLRAHAHAAAVLSSLDAQLGIALRRWLLQHQAEGLAGLTGATGGGGAGPLLFPAPRSFLDRRQRARLEGVRLALEHVDVRVRLFLEGHDPLIRPETPFVLHALVEGRTTGDEETNPGIIRTSVAGWLAAVSPYQHPEAQHARDLVAAVVERAAASTGPAVAVAAWTAFCWMSIHPWVDGNGRTARLLNLLLAAPDLPLHLDYGINEQFTYRRRDYVAALQAGQHTTPTWDPALLDSTPFARAAARWSVEGAALVVRRARAAAEIAGRLHDARPDLSDAGIALTFWIGIRRLTRSADVATTNDETLLRPPLDELWTLADVGVIERRPLPPSRRLDPGVPEEGWRVHPALAGIVGLPAPL